MSALREFFRMHPLAFRASVAIAIGFSFAAIWISSEHHVFRVLGQPAVTGFIQSGVEEPFFRSLSRTSGLSAEFRYLPLERDIAREESGLDALNKGIYDIVSLRFAQLTHVEPVIAGIDLPGTAIDYPLVRAVARRYAPLIDKALQERWGSRLLAVWPFGPQVLICSTPLRGLGDLHGRRVRSTGPTLQALLRAMGAIPITISYADTRRALETRAVDCATSSLVSARDAGWFEVARNILLLPVQFGLNGYAISERAWRMLSASQQDALARSFDAHAQAIWSASEKLHADIVRCATGEDPCVDRMRLVLVQPGQADLQFLRSHVLNEGLEEWAKSAGPCRTCRDDWLRTVGRLLDPSAGTGNRP